MPTKVAPFGSTSKNPNGMGTKAAHVAVADGTTDGEAADQEFEGKQMSPTMKKLVENSAALLENGIFSNMMTGLTIFALIGDDVRIWLCPKALDDAFYALAAVAFMMFALELVCSCLGKPGYFGYHSFYLWLDMISTVSIIPDIGWIWNPFISEFGGGSGGGGAADKSTQAVKAGKASKAGTKASRIIRLVRLVRMVRVVKLYKMHGSKDVEVQSTIEPSKVGKKLTEKTTRRLIVMILSMVIALPFFYPGTLFSSDAEVYRNAGLKNLHEYPQVMNASGMVPMANYERQIALYSVKAGALLYLEICLGCPDEFTTDSVYPLIKSEYKRRGMEPTLYKTRKLVLEEYRESGGEISEIIVSGCYDANGDVLEDNDVSCISWAIFSNLEDLRDEAGMNILKTFFIMVVLGGGALVFSKDAQIYVIGPIERMMKIVKRLAENPLESATMDQSELMDDEKDMKGSGYETALLETTLERVGQLLQIGFGAAGAEIIGNNLNSGSGKLNTLNTGSKITAIYGFCDIRQFTDTTECLQEEVMVYVNKLGHIVHSATHEYYGMANKNVGDAFLLSWKICDGALPGFTNFIDQASEEDRNRANEEVKCSAIHPNARSRRQITPSEMADSAVNAFMRCIIDLENENETGCLAEYATYEAIIKRFGVGFKIKMGFGMHVGWAVEGAIGSELKIDATYLSPHVEMSDRLEAASKIFGAKLNMSHWFVNLCTPTFRKHIRAIDCIKVEGVSVPLTVMTFDIKNFKPKFGTQVYDERTGLPNLTDWNDPEFVEVQQGLHINFLPTFRRGFDAYIKGDWITARDLFEDALRMESKDGPTMFLLNFMEDQGNVVPPDWKGFHELPEF